MHSLQHGCRPVSHAELFVDMLQIFLNDTAAATKEFGNLLIRFPLRQPCQHLRLFGAEVKKSKYSNSLAVLIRRAQNRSATHLGGKVLLWESITNI